MTEVRASYLYLAKYEYASEVLVNDNVLRIFPTWTDGQDADGSQFLTIPGGPETMFFDSFGNEVRRSHIDVPHNDLVIATAGRVVLRPAEEEPPDMPLGDALTAPMWLPQFLTPSPLVDPAKVSALAHEITEGEHTLLGLVCRIVDWVHSEIEYEKGATTVITRPEEVVALRKGVCQDMTHLTLAFLRALWVPCRYVSGLLTGQVGETHAWVEFYHPMAGWIPVDPTRKKAIVTTPDHVKFAVGRDYTDVPPVMGEFVSAGPGSLSKVVAEARLERETPSLEEAVQAVLSA